MAPGGGQGRAVRLGLVLVIVTAVCLDQPAFCAEQAHATSSATAGDKLVRGLANVFLGVLEIPRNIHNTTEEESLLTGWTVGLGKGLGYTILRMVVGVYEVVTFPFPVPKDYAPVIRPDFVWQAPGPRYK